MSFKLPSRIFEVVVLIKKKKTLKYTQSYHLYIQIPKRNASRYKTKHTDRDSELTFKKIFCLFFNNTQYILSLIFFITSFSLSLFIFS